MKKFTKTASASAVAALIALFSATGNATIITSGSNNPLNFNWSFDTGSSLLTGFGSMTISGFNTSLLTVGVSLTNTSLIGGQGGERLTSFGFGIDPNATGVAFADANDGGMVGATLSFIPSLATIEVCAYGGNNCQGGGNGGLFAGTSDAFNILLSGNWGSSVDIAPIGFKYQTGYGSFEFTTTTSTSGGGSTGGGGGSTGNGVPEPGVLGLIGAGLLGQGLLLARRRRNNG